MATQGLVTVRKDGSVVMKFVTGSDGYNAEKLARAIHDSGLPSSLEGAQRMALENSFGSEESLVVMDGDLLRYQDEELPDFSGKESLYRKTFGDPEFNPRWELGVAEHTVIVDL